MISIVSSVNSEDSVRSVKMAVLTPGLMAFYLFNEGEYVIKIISMKASQHCNIMAPFQKWISVDCGLLLGNLSIFELLLHVASNHHRLDLRCALVDLCDPEKLGVTDT